jgi:nucleoside-diphosphate-sugar epimerase
MINTSTLEAARQNNVQRYLLTSSACVYPRYRQMSAEVTPLREEDAMPADPEGGYGWEKLFAEQQCQQYRAAFGMQTRIVRFHNVYGPLGAWEGGREKSPSAICRKIAMASDGDEIEVWGDGEQTRSYCYVDDAVDGMHRVMRSEFADPVNVGQDRLVTVNQLVDIVAGAAGKTVRRRHVLDAPQGVRGRNSDNTLIRRVLGWEPTTTLEEGLARTYRWVEEQVRSRSGSHNR